MPTVKERSSFIGKQAPVEVKQLAKHLRKLKTIEGFKNLVKVATVMLSTPDPSYNKFSSLVQDVDPELVEKLYPGILAILQLALRVPQNQLKKNDFVTDLSELNIPEKHQEPFVQALFEDDHLTTSECLTQSNPRFSSVESFRWRVDVGISTTSLMRTLEPSVLCSIKATDNKKHTFEVSKEKFHELRYAVAEVLNHMQQLEKRSILKIET